MLQYITYIGHQIPRNPTSSTCTVCPQNQLIYFSISLSYHEQDEQHLEYNHTHTHTQRMKLCPFEGIINKGSVIYQI